MPSGYAWDMLSWLSLEMELSSGSLCFTLELAEVFRQIDNVINLFGRASTQSTRAKRIEQFLI